MVTFHGFTEPRPGPPSYDVTHAALALRWPGFDRDEYSPHRKWFPLGATCEFTLSSDLSACTFRILGGDGLTSGNSARTHSILLGQPYRMTSRVESVGTGSALYRARFRHAAENDSGEWDIEFLKDPETVERGCALAIAHHTDVTFGSISVTSI